MMRPLDPTEWLHAKRLEALAAGDHAGFDHVTALLGMLDECQPFLEEERTAIDVLADIDTDMSDYPGANLPERLDWVYRRIDQMTEQYETIRSVLIGADVIGPNEYPDNETIGTLLRMFLPEARD